MTTRPSPTLPRPFASIRSHAHGILKPAGSRWTTSVIAIRPSPTWTEAIRLDPSDFERVLSTAGWRLGAIRTSSTRPSPTLPRRLRLDPKNALAFLPARVLRGTNKNEFDKAIADCNEAIRLDPKNADAFYNRGLALESKKEFDKAIADFNEAIQLDPKNANVFYARGSAWAHKGEMTRPLRISPRPFASIRKTRWRSTIGGCCRADKASTTRPSPTSLR